MKLSKEDLKRLVWHSQGGLNDCDSLAWLELIDGILNGRYDEPLEIEGYVREDHFADADKMVWTKFDPSDPKTHPPAFTRVEFSIDGCITCGTQQVILMATWRGAETIHWRPLPKPPTESEVRK